MLLRKNKLIFNIHLILALISALPLLIITLSGALLSYDKPIANFINHFSLQQPTNSQNSLEFALENFKKNNANFHVLSIQQEEQIWQVRGVENKIRKSIFIDSEGQNLGENTGAKFIRMVLFLHRWLAFDSFNQRHLGKNIVALSTIAFIILSLSGIYLYYPPMRHKLFKSLKIDFKAKKQIVFYKFHCVFGVIFSLIFIFISLTGLYWSYHWVSNLTNQAFGVVENKQKRHEKQSLESKYLFVKEDLSLVLNSFKKNHQNATNLSIFQIKNDKYRLIFTQDKKRHLVEIDTKGNYEKPTQSQNMQKDARWVKHLIFDLHSGRFFGSIGEFIFCLSSFLASLVLLSGLAMSYFRLFKAKKTKI